MGKKWYASKTLWFGVLSVVVAVATSFGFAEYAPEGWASEAIAFWAVLEPVVFIVLRLVTREPVRS